MGLNTCNTDYQQLICDPGLVSADCKKSSNLFSQRNPAFFVFFDSIKFIRPDNETNASIV